MRSYAPVQGTASRHEPLPNQESEAQQGKGTQDSIEDHLLGEIDPLISNSHQRVNDGSGDAGYQSQGDKDNKVRRCEGVTAPLLGHTFTPSHLLRVVR